jgi:hypothetical protein
MSKNFQVFSKSSKEKNENTHIRRLRLVVHPPNQKFHSIREVSEFFHKNLQMM